MSSEPNPSSDLGKLFFNKRRQMGHDMMSRTAVIDEKLVNSSKS
jgi:uncharacterized RDD family membrane protein YckC